MADTGGTTTDPTDPTDPGTTDPTPVAKPKPTTTQPPAMASDGTPSYYYYEQPPYQRAIFTVSEPVAGRAWFVLGRVALVHTLQRASKISAWSRVRLPGLCRAALVTPAGMLVRLDDGRVLQMKPGNALDDAAVPVMRARLPFLDMQAPGVEKYLTGLDVVCEGVDGGRVRLLLDPRQAGNPDAVPPVEPVATPWQPINGDAREGLLLPVEATAEAVAVEIEHAGAGAFAVDQIALEYRTKGKRTR